MRLYDMVDGIRLEVGPSWLSCTEEERDRMCNGVGGADQPEWLGKLLGVLPFLYRASLVHDVDYATGGGDGARHQVDLRFRRNCLRVAEATLWPRWWPRWARGLLPGRTALYLAARAEIEVAYLALRKCGGATWTYK
jgi:hypothetical protein